MLRDLLAEFREFQPPPQYFWSGRRGPTFCLLVSTFGLGFVWFTWVGFPHFASGQPPTLTHDQGLTSIVSPTLWWTSVLVFATWIGSLLSVVALTLYCVTHPIRAPIRPRSPWIALAIVLLTFLLFLAGPFLSPWTRRHHPQPTPQAPFTPPPRPISVHHPHATLLEPVQFWPLPLGDALRKRMAHGNRSTSYA